MLEPRSRGGGGKSSGDGKIGTGRETLRLRSKGPATVEEMVTVFSQCCNSELYLTIKTEICTQSKQNCEEKKSEL